MSATQSSDRPVAPARPGATGPMHAEQTRWSMGLISFYLSCAGVALGAGFAASGYCFFGSTGWLVFGSAMSAVSCILCYYSLCAARRKPDSSGQTNQR